MALAPPVAEQRWLARSAFAGNDDALGHLLTIHRPAAYNLAFRPPAAVPTRAPTAVTLAVSPRPSRPRASGRTYASGANPYLSLTRA
jgi:hypothetical protein